MEYVFTAQNFDREVLQSEQTVLVDFYADWCMPCKMMAPVIASLAEKLDGKMKVGKCNIDQEQEIAQRYKIMSVPTMVVFRQGKIETSLSGVMSQEELEKKLR